MYLQVCKGRGPMGAGFGLKPHMQCCKVGKEQHPTLELVEQGLLLVCGGGVRAHRGPLQGGQPRERASPYQLLQRRAQPVDILFVGHLAPAYLPAQSLLRCGCLAMQPVHGKMQ